MSIGASCCQIWWMWIWDFTWSTVIIGCCGTNAFPIDRFQLALISSNPVKSRQLTYCQASTAATTTALTATTTEVLMLFLVQVEELDLRKIFWFHPQQPATIATIATLMVRAPRRIKQSIFWAETGPDWYHLSILKALERFRLLPHVFMDNDQNKTDSYAHPRSFLLFLLEKLNPYYLKILLCLRTHSFNFDFCPVGIAATICWPLFFCAMQSMQNTRVSRRRALLSMPLTYVCTWGETTSNQATESRNR